MKLKIIICMAALLLMYSCNDNPPPPSAEDKGFVLALTFRPTFGGNDLSWVNPYITNAGDTVTFDKIKLLLSNITLEKSNGELVVLKDQYGFLDLKEGRDSVQFSGVPAGDYKSIRFQVGLDSSINHGDPIQWKSGEHPLSPALNDMHWSWNTGYIFSVIEGYFQNKGIKAGFSFHIATDQNARIFSFVYDYSIKKNARFVMDLRADKYFSNMVNFSLKNDGSFSHSGDPDPVMDKFMQNVNGVFEIESFH